MNDSVSEKTFVFRRRRGNSFTGNPFCGRYNVNQIENIILLNPLNNFMTDIVHFRSNKTMLTKVIHLILYGQYH